MDEYPNNANTPSVLCTDNWNKTSVKVKLPTKKVQFTSELDAPEFEVPDLFYRKPLELLRSAFNKVSAQMFHTKPFKLFWKQSPSVQLERIYGDLYTGDAMLAEHESIQCHKSTTGTLENVIAAIMVWSDSTHLANFGNAALWSIYVFIGNQSKYIHCKPTSFSTHHLAYIPKLPDRIQEVYQYLFGKSASSATLTHCRHELFHSIWNHILDADFIHAYEHGFDICFPDGILRKVFLRFFTYAADYPEKVLIMCMKYLGKCPCPHCLVKKDQILMLSSKNDRMRCERYTHSDDPSIWQKIDTIRRWIFKKGRSLVSQVVDAILGIHGLVPLCSTFSERLAQFGLDIYSLLVPDLLHKFELGVWKAMFTHLIRCGTLPLGSVWIGEGCKGNP
ncbi:hypothetical protein M404DRAFT_168210 [Pisolithus tinctorius Marx 270]|uniref:Uncharacterized protein n=1 Tax=Pisolithus tinctorius Marx 270 TaxID=870435 RepID=A0A0C3NFC8_PISTI|nr:hypothetical protein M404DRAFT_168210 [Pisolithus tinctorius Marx 270]